MDSTQLRSFLLTVIAGTVFPGHILSLIPVTEKSFEQAVLTPFVDGLNSLMSIAQTVLTSSNLPQVIQNVRQLLESSHKSLSEAEKSSVAQEKSLSANVEELSDQINRLNNEQKVLQDKQKGEIQEKESLSRQREAAQKDLKNANDDIDKGKKAWQDAQTTRKVGLGMMFIPIIGAIAGGISMGKGAQDLKKAAKQIRAAQSKRKIHTQAVEKFTSDIQTYETAVSSTVQTIATNTEKIEFLQQDLNSETARHQNLNKFLISLRKCTSLLRTGAGLSMTANMNLELSGVLDGLLGVLGEIVVTLRPLVESSKEYSLLISVKLPTIIQKLEEANRMLKKAAAS
ncbi:uncharacterized protein LOC144817794 [Lissotriton helveticus]